ncbi:MAG: ribonuclease HII [Trueperaceae bacterium]|nr:ribonuclease HII [Trueperaceae bacterium]
MKPSWTFETKFWKFGYSLVAGIDEAGRGALAGPVVAAAVILPYKTYPFRDSKTLSAKQRREMAATIKREAVAWSLGQASPEEIDRLNILQATHLAARRALEGLEPKPEALITDYLKLQVAQPLLAPAKADNLSFQVAAASILAKTTRDGLMEEYAESYRDYDFASNKGYGSSSHLKALSQKGACPIHRRSFKPVMQGRLFLEP